MIRGIRNISEPHGEKVTMSTKKKKRIGRLSLTILKYLILCVLIAVFVFIFLYSTSVSIADTYIIKHGISVDHDKYILLTLWIRNVSVLASMIVFIALFLFMLGQKLTYLFTIIEGVDKLRQNNMDFYIEPEGDDELRDLADSINFLSVSQRQLNEKEKTLKDEREAWVRSMSHDIRTPITSILSYSEIMASKTSPTREEISSYISLVTSKTRQIKHLSDRLMNSSDGVWQEVGDIRLLLEQLAVEWQLILEDKIPCRIDMSACGSFTGIADIHSLKRIFDNLASNVEKYADRSFPAELMISSDKSKVTIIQKNRVKRSGETHCDSHNIGLDNIKNIAEQYNGRTDISFDDSTFEISVTLYFKHNL